MIQTEKGTNKTMDLENIFERGVNVYQLLDGPLDGVEITLPIRISAPSRLEVLPNGGIMDESIGHYYACMAGDPDGNDYRQAYAWYKEKKKG